MQTQLGSVTDDAQINYAWKLVFMVTCVINKVCSGFLTLTPGSKVKNGAMYGCWGIVSIIKIENFESVYFLSIRRRYMKRNTFVLSLSRAFSSLSESNPRKKVFLWKMSGNR